MCNFFFYHYVFKKPSAAEASESVYMRERVKLRFYNVLNGIHLDEPLDPMSTETHELQQGFDETVNVPCDLGSLKLLVDDEADLKSLVRNFYLFYSSLLINPFPHI